MICSTSMRVCSMARAITASRRSGGGTIPGQYTALERVRGTRSDSNEIERQAGRGEREVVAKYGFFDPIGIYGVLNSITAFVAHGELNAATERAVNVHDEGEDR